MTDEQQVPEIPEEENFAALFAASLEQETELRKGIMVHGSVVSVTADAVIMDVGAKAEGSIASSEFATMGRELPSVGDELDAMILAETDRDGLTLSVLAAYRQQLWDQVSLAHQEARTIEVTITSEIKGGYRVDLGGLTAFMPRSEADPNPKATSGLVGTRCECAILDVSRRPDNIVVSRKQPLLAVQEEQRAAFFEQTKVGSRVNGVVRRLADFGAFIDLGGVDALLHVSDISWRRIEHPSEMLAVNQPVTVEVLKLDAETGKVSVSIKSMQDDPWTHVEQTYEENMRVTGTVLKLLDFGAVVELEPGVEGLIHRSEMSWMRKDVKPTELLTEGDVVDVAILEVKVKGRRIRLSLKEVADNPWEAWLAEHPVGTRVTGKVRNITDFGFFVGLGDQMDGLVHLANISWTERGEVAMEHFHKGQEVEAVVLGVDIERQRISLGVKQAAEDPFEVFVHSAKRGAVVKGTITENVCGAYLVELADGIRARLGMREMPRDSDELKVGDVIDAKIIDVNRRRRQVELSVRQYLRDEERDAVRQYSQQTEAEENLSPLAIELKKKFFSANK